MGKKREFLIFSRKFAAFAPFALSLHYKIKNPSTDFAKIINIPASFFDESERGRKRY
jgi:hypothetical protein